MKLPFWIWPWHWGLRGDALELAKIDYNYTGVDAAKAKARLRALTEFELDVLLNEIDKRFGMVDDYTFEQNVLTISLKYKKITNDEYMLGMYKNKLAFNKITEDEYQSFKIELMPNETERVLAALEYTFSKGEITQDEYDKEVSNLKKEPWFSFNASFDENNKDIVVTFDYNEYFWKQLEKDGHPGNDEEELINNFIRDWGRKLATEESDENINVSNALNDPKMIHGISNPDGTKTYK